jgi:hypothetical protein
MKPCRAIHKTPVFLGLAACLAIAGCIFDGNQPVAPLTMQFIGAMGDTVSPLAELRFAFSDSLVSPLDFTFTPPVAQLYEISFNPSHDTATVSFLEMLPGNSRFLLKLKSPIISKNGSTLNPGNDSAIIYTASEETEPNNSPGTADTLSAAAKYGMLADAADTDVYCVPSGGSVFCFEAFTDQTTFSVRDGNLSDVACTIASGPAADTVTIPASASPPVSVFVFSSVRGTTGYYRIGPAR